MIGTRPAAILVAAMLTSACVSEDSAPAGSDESGTETAEASSGGISGVGISRSGAPESGGSVSGVFDPEVSAEALGADLVLRTCRDGPDRQPNYGRAQAGIFIGQGWNAVEAGNAALALNLFVTALNTGPERPEAYWGLGVASHLTGHSDETVDACFARVREMLPGEPLVYTDYGRVLLVRERFQDAVPVYEQALALDGENAETHARLGAALAKVGDEARAREHFARARALGFGG